ncbi:hypothetical protein X975_19533, partial [Stegodyphus mimosarum]
MLLCSISFRSSATVGFELHRSYIFEQLVFCFASVYR